MNFGVDGYRDRAIFLMCNTFFQMGFKTDQGSVGYIRFKNLNCDVTPPAKTVNFVHKSSVTVSLKK